MYSRKKVRYRRDGYCWKKRKDGKTTREDHMKLKVQGIEVSRPISIKCTLRNLNENFISIFFKIEYLGFERIFYFYFSAFMDVTFILQSYQRFIDDVTGFYR